MLAIVSLCFGVSITTSATPKPSTFRNFPTFFLWVVKFLKVDGFGVAEVVIETPKHNETIANMPDEDVKNIIVAYRDMYHEIARGQHICLINIFRNHGQKAGTSL